MSMNLKQLSLFLMAFLLSAGGDSDEQMSPEAYIESLSFYASFDYGFDADVSRGDSVFYMASSWSSRDQLRPFTDTSLVEIHQDMGVYQNALWIENSYTPVFLYKGADNMPYTEENWSGTVSFWMRVSPDEDLPDGFSDPIQITPREWNNGALFVDFTDQVPRIFRFAAFADRDVWDPDYRDWDEVPEEERPMIDVEQDLFHHEEWTHVALTFQNFNTGEANGVVDGYINGTHYGSITEREQTFTWNPEEVFIWLGYNYTGYLDELAIFDRALSESEIRTLFTLPYRLGDHLE
jgi:hypothetical protein